MNSFEIKYSENCASQIQIFEHLSECSKLFTIPLSDYVDIKQYSIKIRNNSITIEAWEKEKLVGLLAIYLNDLNNIEGYITNVSVVESFQAKGISSQLLSKTIAFTKLKKYKRIKLSVHKENNYALKLYEKYGFKITEEDNDNFIMTKKIEIE
jgi:ribosomal protein S18 acetylase RimI-like enzyme